MTSILKIPLVYLVTVLLLLAAYAASRPMNELLGKVLPVPILPSLISQFLGLFLLTADMRILGLLYRAKKSELGLVQTLKETAHNSS